LQEPLGVGEQVEIHFSPWIRWFLRALGMGPKRTGIVLTPDEVQVKAGSFRVMVSRDQIASVRECSPPRWAQAGVHTDLRGRWIIDGGPGRLVRLDLSPPAQGQMAGMTVSVRRLDLGLEDSASFMAKLASSRVG
jgi:hypothetical protein